MTSIRRRLRRCLLNIIAVVLRVSVLAVVFAPIAAALGLLVTDRLAQNRRASRLAPSHGEFDATVADSDLRIYTAGADLFDDMISAIDEATSTVMLQTFIWKADDVGHRFLEAVNRAAERGVDVYLIRDVSGNYGFDSIWKSRRMFSRLHPRIHDFHMWPIASWFWRGPIRATGVNHSKVLVVDDRIGFIGGINIGEPYARQWRDTHLREVGSSVWSLRQAFVTVWNANKPASQQIPWVAPDPWNPRVSVAANLPVQQVYPIRRMYISAIERSRSHVWLNTPYFVPDQQLFTTLIDASARGVDVRLMVPRRNNHIVVDWVARGFYGQMLDRGIRIFLYEPAMIHAKTAVVDGQWATIGTANLDRLSLALNYEINIQVFDPDFASRVEEIFQADSQHCEEIDALRWRRRNALVRATELALIPMRALL